MIGCRTVVLLLLLLYTCGTSSLFFQSTPSPPYRCLPGLSISQLENITLNMADMSRFYSHFLDRILVPRVPGTHEHAMVGQFIEREMQSLGWTVELDAFTDQTPYGPKLFTNIIATLNPTAKKRIVFACHYDSKYFEDIPNFVGATDSAVPCAILIDTAWKLKEQLLNVQEVTPQFIFFDGEEALVRWTATDSLYGSRHLASTWLQQPDPNDPQAADNLENIELFVLLDLIGGPNLIFNDFFYNTSTQFYSLYRIEYCLTNNGIIPARIDPYYRNQILMFDPRRRQRTVIEDDHIPFIHKGVPVLHLISQPFPSVWHRWNDDLNHLDRPTVAKFATVFRLYLFRLFNV